MVKRATNWAEIKKAVMAGVSMREAAQLFEVGASSIMQRSHLEHWDVKRGRGRGVGARQAELVKRIEEKAEEKAAVMVAENSRVVQEHRETMLALSMASRRSLAEVIRKGMNYLSGLPEAELAKQHRVAATFVSAGEALFGWRALAAVEAEAAVERVRAESGRKDQRAINLELIRVKPQELREMAQAKKAREAQGAGVREVEESPGVRAEG
jgi:hypothetical protein